MFTYWTGKTNGLGGVKEAISCLPPTIHSHLTLGDLNKSHDKMGHVLTLISPLTPSNDNDLHLLSHLGSWNDTHNQQWAQRPPSKGKAHTRD